MTQQKKKRIPKSKQITLKEFKAWLQGVEELQSDDWHPTKEQWQKIRDKIDTIVEPEPNNQASSTVQQPQPAPAVPQQQTPPPPMEQVDTPPTPPPSASGGGVPTPTGPPVGNSNLAAAGPPPQQVPQQGSSGIMPAGNSDSAQIKTPDIDTSEGGYGSMFE